jgi:hypothetical protein
MPTRGHLRKLYKLPIIDEVDGEINALAEFTLWWNIYPLKVAKLAAEKAYLKARTKASQQQLLDGVMQYRLNKPAYADWCHPATWLNAGRWMDEVPLVVPKPTIFKPSPDEMARAKTWMKNRRGGCPHEPTCDSADRCMGIQIRIWRDRMAEGFADTGAQHLHDRQD